MANATEPALKICGNCHYWMPFSGRQTGECCWCPDNAPSWLINIEEITPFELGDCAAWEPKPADAEASALAEAHP